VSNGNNDNLLLDDTPGPDFSQGGFFIFRPRGWSQAKWSNYAVILFGFLS
jgi:hypothetical protein